MSLQEFKKYNNITGWILFAISALVYILTMESSASFWDCGEFIAASYKMQVVHPPGAPVFIMIGRIFSLLSFGNVEMVSVMMNLMSALCSAFAMLFLFWSITHLARRAFIKGKEELTTNNVIAILGSGFIGALAGTFCDSIWFSAAEAEVYSMSLFFTALVVWLMLKWDEHADEPYADRWLVLIFFLMGVSIGVHWLNLLTIPAMGYIYYFRRYKPNFLGIVLTAIISFAILGFIMKVVITGLAGMANGIELTFVNSFGMPFNSGVIFFVVLLIAALAAAMYFFRKANLPLLFNITLAFVMMLIGFSPLVTTVIRANADTPINMNDPKDMPSLMSFLNREQYGERPLLTGPYYHTKVVDIDTYGHIWKKMDDDYKKVGKKFRYVYDDKTTTFFPRMHSSEESHIPRYEKWVDLRPGQKPSYGDNLEFFWKYQLGWMYWRYFNWNFVGRQNDIQGFGGPTDGNWISGLSFIDNARLGPQGNLPDYKKNNPARNKFFFIPLLLGLLGFVFHFKNDRQRAFAILALFVSTGILLIVYGNSPPVEPRERDYIFAGSFWAFCMWIGLGVMGLYEIISNVSGKSSKRVGAIAAIAVASLAPILMGWQGWDDHNRGGRTVARDMAKNYLESCEPNAILFTQGDNDTYPLWYAQEVENIRPDIRIVNLSLLGVDWYINQLRKRHNEADPVKFTASPEKYMGDKRNFLTYSENPNIAPKDRYIDLYEIVNFMNSDNKNNQRKTVSNEYRNYFPTKNFSITVDKNAIFKNKVVSPVDVPNVVDQMQWKMKRGTLMKNDIQMLDIIATNAKNGWEKPVYFAVSINPSSFLGLEKYFQLEGFTYRLVPIKTDPKNPYTGRIRTDAMYDNLMNDFTFGGLEKPGTATDETIRRMASNLRSNYARLATKLVKEGKNKEAIELLDKGLKGLPNENVPYDFFTIFAAEAFYDAGSPNKAVEVSRAISENLLQDMEYVKSLPSGIQRSFKKSYDMADLGMSQLLQLASQNQKNNWALEVSSRYEAAQVPAFNRRK